MWCIMLSAGYATRLRPYTDHMPKALLPVAGRAILDYVMDKVEEVEGLEGVIMVSNHRYIEPFTQWAENYAKQPGAVPVRVLDDGSTTNDNRLGAIGDIRFALEQTGIDEDVLIMGSDNLFDFSMNDMVRFFREKQADCISAHAIDSLYDLRRSGIVALDDDQRVLDFWEKPEDPQTHWAVPPFYIYRRETLPLIHQYLEEGNNPDAPGHFVPYLMGKKPVYAYIFEGMRYDIGTPESYHHICDVMEARKQ